MTGVAPSAGKSIRRYFAALFTIFCFLLAPVYASAQTVNETSLELVRPIRSWEFISALGTRGAILGTEGGDLEAWIYPLKIFRNFQLRFKVDGQFVDGKAIARSLCVRPESTTITYVWDTFSIRETLFVPVDEPGAVIDLEVEAAQPVEIEAIFERDFQLEWPGAMGGSDIDWVPALHAFAMTENQHKFSALIGSTAALDFHIENVTNYSATKENIIGFGSIPAGHSTRQIVMAASFADLPSAETTYRKLSNSYSQLLSASRDYYQTYLNSHVSLDLPDPVLQQAYQWAQVSVLQGLVKNPFLGTGLVAGYRGSGDDQRPGYAWFFGRDALWTALALDAEGDFATTRAALQFLGKYQRADGKVTHEIAQGASFVPWFQSMPYAYASADATPLFIIATDDYVRRSGDTQFAGEAWDKLWLAYKFIVSTYDSGGLPRNDGIGHGWVEGGPLLPVRTEIYQAGVVTQALKSLASLASIVGKQDVSSATTAEFESKQVLLNRAFWITEQKRYAFGLDLAGRQVDTPSVLAAVPMWFGLLDNEKAASMIARLNQPDIQSDWGMRIIPSTSPKYEAAGYHSGTVWPLFTGWASVADYKYHDAFSGFSNLRTNALLTFDGSLGHVTEVLSGNYYQTLATGSPQQVWSSAMVISPILTGLFGLQVDSLAHHVEFDPHVPANWTRFAIKHVQAGECTLDFSYRKVVNMLTLEIQHTGGVCNLDFSPALSPRTHVLSAELNGHPVVFQMRANETDQHVSIPVNVKAPVESLVIHLKDDFGLSQEFALPSLGSESDGMRIVSENWNEGEDLLTLNASSTSGGTFDLDVWNAAEISSVDGAELLRTEPNQAKLRIHLSKTMPTQDARREVLIHLRHNQAMHHERFVQPDGQGESHDH